MMSEIKSEVGTHKGLAGRFYPRKPLRETEKTRNEWKRQGLTIKTGAEPVTQFMMGHYKANFYSAADTVKAGNGQKKYQAAIRVAQHLRLRADIYGKKKLIWSNAQDLYKQLFDHGWEYDREKEVWRDKEYGVEVGY